MLLALLDAPGRQAVRYSVYRTSSLKAWFWQILIIQEDSMPIFTILAGGFCELFLVFLGLFLAIPLLIVFQIYSSVLVKDVLNKCIKKSIKVRAKKIFSDSF